MADYKYSAQLNMVEGSTPHGVRPTALPWTDANVGTIYTSGPYTYWYVDNSRAQDTTDNCSQVEVFAKDTFSGTFDSSNNLIITITTTVDLIQRSHVVGNPNIGGVYTRDISLSPGKGQAAVWHIDNNNIGVAAVLGGPITIATRTITIPPTGSSTQSSLYLLNHTNGFPWQQPYLDEMEMGTSFQNPRSGGEPPEPERPPLDYRPGATWNGSRWMSHNRNGGAASQYRGRWAEMRTHSGEDYENQPETGDPPSIRTASTWRNMFNIGANRWPDPPGDPYDDEWT